jgi:hypothetical protein
MDIAMNPAAPSPAHLAQLGAARLASKKIRRVIAVANFDGWGIAVFAAITLVFSLTSLSGILLGLGMAYVAWRELSSAAALGRLDIGATRRLASNQLVLCALLILYFAWSLYQSLNETGDYSEILAASPGTAGMVRAGTIIVYGGLIVGSMLFQGGTAWYYSSRGKVVEQYLAATPQWIIDYQRGGGTL